MKMKSLAMGAVSAFTVLALVGCSSGGTGGSIEGGDSSTPGSIQKIKVQAQNSIAAEPLYMGIKQGFFKKQGLEIEIVDIPDTATAFAAVQSGRLDVAFSPTIGVMQAARQNLPLTMIAASDGINPEAIGAPQEEQRNYTSAGIYVSKGSGITDIKGLAGASIAVPILKSQPDATITSVLQEAKVPTDAVNWLLLDFVPSVAALKDNKVDAAFLVSPFSIEADSAGLKRIMNPSVEFFPPGAATSAWVANKDYAAKNAKTVAAFQRAMVESSTYARDNLELAKKSAIERTGLKIDPKDMPKSYWPSEIREADMQKINDKLVAINFFTTKLDVSTIITPQK